MNQTNKRLMEREKASAPDARLYPMPPAAHPKAPKTKDPRRDPNVKVTGENTTIKGRDHNHQIDSGPTGYMTLMVMS